MMLSTRSFVLILFAWGLVLSVPSLILSANANPEPTTRSSPPGPVHEPQGQPQAQTGHAQQPPPPTNSTAATAIRKPSTQDKEYASSDDAQSANEDWRVWLPNWLLIGIGGVAAYIALRTLKVIELQTEATRTAATAALEEAKAMTLAERAYVKMSHCPPGLQQVANSPLYDIQLQIKNFGHTPATVTGVVLTYKIVPHEDLLPTVPEYGSGTGQLIRRVFLVREEDFFTHQTFTILSPDFTLIENETNDICIYGYVDYIDQFGTRHRAGYARRYEPRANDARIYRTDEAFRNRSNLMYVTQPRYNYDRRREHGEGNDWDEPT